MSPDRRQAIIRTNAGMLLIGTLGTDCSEILIEIYTLLFKKMHLKMSSPNWQPLCLGNNVLTCGKPFSEPMLEYLKIGPWETNFYGIFIQMHQCLLKK